MKIYKVYHEINSESSENSVSAFTDILMEQNKDYGKFFTDYAEAKAAYDKIVIKKEARELRYVTTTYHFDGKLLEVGEISGEEYAARLSDGDSLCDIYGGCTSWEDELVQVSHPASNSDDPED